MKSAPNQPLGRICRQLLVVCLGACAALPSVAADVPWLYDVEVPVADQTPLARVEAAGRGLAGLLTRLTGLTEVPESETVSRALGAPDLYYNQFSYAQDADGALELELQFVPRAVLGLIRDAGLPIWRANRPTVVAWVVLDDGGKRRILGAASEHPTMLALKARARERGVPLQLPLLDLTDQLAVEPAAVWGRLSQTLLPASQRYGADIVLVGRLESSGATWTGSWEFWVDGQVRQQYLQAEAPEALGTAAANLVANELASRYAVLDRGVGRLALSVSSIDGPTEYADMLRYFNGLEFVEGVEITAVDGNRVKVSLVTAARPEQLLELFRLDRRLFPDSLNSAPGGGLGLVWQRR